MAELVRRQMVVDCHAAGTAAALAAKAATTTIPTVFLSTDRVQVGLVPSLKRPGGNLTGVNYMQSGAGAKRLGLLRLGCNGRWL